MFPKNAEPRDTLLLVQVDAQAEPDLAACVDFEAFWKKRFHVFPWRVDRWALAHWYILTIFLPLVLLLLLLLADFLSGVAYFGESFEQFVGQLPDLIYQHTIHNWVFLIGVVTISLAALAFNRWCEKIPVTFQELFSNKRLQSLSGEDVSIITFYEFLESYRRALRGKGRFILLGVFLLVFWGLIWGLGGVDSFTTVIHYYSSTIPANPLLQLLGIIQLVFYALGTPFVVLLEGYFLAIGLWALWVSGRYLRKLALQFSFRIQPNHPDNCGGLRSLGDFALALAFPMLILILLFGIYTLIGFTPLGKYLIEPVFARVLLPVTVVFGLIAFFVPLWNIHLKMVAEKKRYAEAFASRATKLDQETLAYIDAQATDVSLAMLRQARVVQNQRAALEAFHPAKVQYPAWPFDNRIVWTFLAPQIPVLLTIFAGFKGSVIDFVKSVLGL